ncbi:hypothetical protein MMC28_006714 [Mycoblastus sanguinarius]|nr:hypothetical protein [Mycoblastus sanguinarius]
MGLHQGAFTTHCMLPSLQLLLACHDPATSDNPTDGLASLLERLITKHVILPAHASFLDQAWAKGFQDGQTPQSLSTTLVSTLESFRFPEITPDFHAIKIRNHLTISFLSLLFELAIGCYKDSEPQILKVENPWLGELFNQLGDCARTVLSPKYESQAQKYYARVLEWMLRKAVNHQIRLSTSTLGRALKKASGLFNKGRSENTVTDQENEMEDGDRTKGMSDKTENNQENGPHKGSLPSETSQKPEENQRNETSQRNEADGTQKKEDKSHVEWGLVNLCLLNDANTFLIPSAKRKKSNQPRNKYLDALLNKITDYTCNLRMEDDEDYHFKRSNIIIPLCDAFIGARDLLGFLRHWKEQLTICEQSRKTAATFIRSIWEDEIIIQCIANSIELALTSRQIDQVLSAAANDLAHLTFDVLSDQPNLLASLVVLDAIFAGLTREETLNEVDRTAKSIFCLLEVTLSNDANCLQKYRWRIWRIETEIIDGWLSLDKTVELEGNAGSSLVSKASRLLESPSSENTEGVEPDYSEALYAFRFLLSLARFNKAWPAPFEVTSQQIVAQAIENILTIKEFFTRQLREDHFGLLKPLDTFPVFNRVASTVKSVDSYYIGCMVQLLQSPVALE